LVIVFQKLEKKRTQQLSFESTDGPLDYSLNAFEVNVYNLIFDKIIQGISSRFSLYSQLFADFSCLNPNNFKVNMPLPTTALSSLHDKIVHFIPEISYDTLRDEFTDLMSKWSEFKKTLFCENYDYTEYNSDNEYDGDDEDKCPHTTTDEKYCVVCIFNFLVKYNLYINAYPGLYNCSKLILTLSVTQVSCNVIFQN